MPAGQRRTRGDRRAPDRSSRRSRAARIASRSTDADLQPLLALLRGRPPRRRLRDAASSWRCSGSSPARSSCSASSAIPPDAAPGAVYRISDLELASRLSFFLWSSIPDDELLERARRQGSCKTPAVLEQQVRRMLADPKRAGARRQLRRPVAAAAQPAERRCPNSDEFPDFDDNLRQAFQRETELFFDSIMREDRNVLDLLTADYTFVNERLARHYGIPNVYGSHFRRVPLTDDARKGLLGQGQHPRGHVARRPDVAGRARQVDSREHPRHAAAAAAAGRARRSRRTRKAQKPRTMREQMEEHRANPVCASCHKVMDPLGFALENFDAVGALADRGRRRADRCVRRAGRRHDGRRRRRRCATRCSAGPTSSSAR